MEHKKSFYLALVTTAALLLLGWVMLVQSIVGKPNAGTRNLYYFALKKRELAENAPSPKMVLIGGSNVLYGLSATTLSKKLQLPAYNCGVSAVWGPEYMIWNAKLVLKRGDIVVFFPEYGHYAYDGTPNVTMLEYVISRDQQYLGDISLPLKLRLYFSYDNRSLKKQMKVHFDADENEEGRKKSQARLDDHGDIIYLEPSTAEDLEKRGTICQELFRPLPSSTYRGLIHDFKGWCDQNGILFLAGCPTLYNHKTYNSPVVEENFLRIRKFYEGEGVPFLGNPRDFLYPLDLIYNTRDHLTAEGKVIHTDKMAELLLPYVEKWKNRSISAPPYGLGIQ